VKALPFSIRLFTRLPNSSPNTPHTKLRCRNAGPRKQTEFSEPAQSPRCDGCCTRTHLCSSITDECAISQEKSIRYLDNQSAASKPISQTLSSSSISHSSSTNSFDSSSAHTARSNLNCYYTNSTKNFANRFEPIPSISPLSPLTISQKYLIPAGESSQNCKKRNRRQQCPKGSFTISLAR
jgi:hypothetical protein